ncbi:MAG: CHAT domain-containing protein [Niveispirillum sp.]|uniref:CHAT domain-containing protein n=1 Tax=Niveispirillum sp. TaxID=1917217 RepID=UPI003BA441D1
MNGKPPFTRLFTIGLALGLLLVPPVRSAPEDQAFLAGTIPMVGKEGRVLEPLECVAITSPNPAAVMRAARLTELRCTGSSLADAEIIATREPQDQAWNAYVARTFQCEPATEHAGSDLQEATCRATGRGWRRQSLRLKQGDSFYYVLVVPTAREAALTTVDILAGKRERLAAPATAMANLYDETRLLNGDPQTAYYEASRAAENYMAREDYEKAERALRGALDAWERMPVDPGMTKGQPPATLLLMYALALSNQERFVEANAQFLKVAESLPNIEPPANHKIFRAMHAVNQRDLDTASRLLDQAAAEYEILLSPAGDARRRRIPVDAPTQRLGLSRDTLDMEADIAPTLLERTRPELLDNYRALLYLQAEIAVRRGNPALAIKLLSDGADRIERDLPTASSAFASRTWSAALHEAAGADGAALAKAVGRLELASNTLAQIGLGGRPQAVTWMRLDALYRAAGVDRRDDARLFDKARNTLRAFGQFVSPAELEAHMLTQYNQARQAEGQGDRAKADSIYRQMLDDLQLIRGPRITQAMVDNALSADSGNEEVKRLVQRIRVLERDIRQTNDEVGQLLATPDNPGRAQQLETLKTRVTDSQEALLAEQLTLQEKAPTFSKLAQAPVKIADVQSRMAGGAAPEALVTFMMGPKHTFGFRLDATQVKVWMTPLTSRDGEALIRTVRASAALEDAAAQAPPAQDGPQKPPPFDKQAARDLYKGLFIDRSWLVNATGTPYQEVKVITSGSLATLPLAVLIADDLPPGVTDWDQVPLWDVQWLIKDVAITYLPSLRAVAASTAGPPRTFGLDYLGFGVDKTNRLTGELAASLPAACADDVTILRGMSELSAEQEVTDAAAAFNTGAQTQRADHIRGADFTAAAIDANADRMRQARILHFASHAFQAGVLKCLKEPGIQLAPPARAQQFEDLFLTATAVSRLKLDADLVVLSACSTAASGGGADREPLSGLVNGFLVAGARSVMTTFWDAPDVAANMATNGMFKQLRENPGLSVAEALRRAQLTLLRAPLTTAPDGSLYDQAFSHPVAWAVFGLVGDGSGGDGATNPPS